jgi:hypothetical protein
MHGSAWNIMLWLLYDCHLTLARLWQDLTRHSHDHTWISIFTECHVSQGPLMKRNLASVTGHLATWRKGRLSHIPKYDNFGHYRASSDKIPVLSHLSARLTKWEFCQACHSHMWVTNWSKLYSISTLYLHPKFINVSHLCTEAETWVITLHRFIFVY